MLHSTGFVDRISNRRRPVDIVLGSNRFAQRFILRLK